MNTQIREAVNFYQQRGVSVHQTNDMFLLTDHGQSMQISARELIELYRQALQVKHANEAKNDKKRHHLELLEERYQYTDA